MERDLLIEAYDYAKTVVESSGFGDEIFWQQQLRFSRITETDFLRESAWVIFCSGFSEKVLRRKFPFLSLCFCDWESAEAIADAAPMCRANALQGLGHAPKIDAVLQIAELVSRRGFDSIKEEIQDEPIQFLQSLPFIGSVTCWHLAKNLGVPVAKPDRHLVRIAGVAGFPDVHAVCAHLAEVTGDSIPVVDIVLWRFATIEKRYEDIFKLKGSFKVANLHRKGTDRQFLDSLVT